MQTLIVVGARGLGRAVALHFARADWQVACAARTAADVEALARAVDGAGGRGLPVACDVTDQASLAPLVAMAADLCVVAQSPGGRFGARPLLELDDEDLQRGLRVSLAGAWNLLRTVGRGMVERRRGTFLQIGTSSGVRTRDGFAGLGAVQQGLRALVQVAAREWRVHGVHVAYLPIDGGIESERTAAFGADKLVPPSEIARACEYLHGQPPRAWTHELLLRPTGGDWTAPT
jgi:NAD(P)-dependent dehydrogenase (short-subunit alcohol dehydrogenase family)